jgi:hypothetical protein
MITNQKKSKQRKFKLERSNQNKDRTSQNRSSFVLIYTQTIAASGFESPGAERGSVCQRGQQGEQFSCRPFLLFVFNPPQQAWFVFWLIYLNYSTCFRNHAGVN